MGNCCKSDQHHVHNQHAKIPDSPMHYVKSFTLQVSNSITDISNDFIFDKVIGKGHFGIVRKGYLKQASNIEVAIKSRHKKYINYDDFKLRREIEILKYTDHPNIVKYYECFEDDEYIHIVTEYCSGGELFTKIISKGSYSEEEAKLLVYKMFKVVNYLHCKGIIHRDIKPENFMFENNEENAEFRLIDFGLSIMMNDGLERIKENRIIGSPLYIAPEALEGEYGYEGDIWSLGVIMFALLSGKVPFPGRKTNDIFELIRKCDYKLIGPKWKNVSNSAKDLISKILVKNPRERITALQVINHPWLAEARHTIDLQVDTQVINNLRSFKSISRIRYEGISEYVKYLNIPHLIPIRSTFLALDTEHTGKLRPRVLTKALRSFHIFLSEHRISKILKYTSYLSQDYLTYTNFVCAVISTTEISINSDKITQIFQKLDSDRCGQITSNDIIEYMKRKGITIPLNQAEDMIQEVTQGEDIIILEEFQDHLLNIDISNTD